MNAVGFPSHGLPGGVQRKFIDLWPSQSWFSFRHSPSPPMYSRLPNCLRAVAGQPQASLPRGRQNLVFRQSLRPV